GGVGPGEGVSDRLVRRLRRRPDDLGDSVDVIGHHGPSSTRWSHAAIISITATRRLPAEHTPTSPEIVRAGRPRDGYRDQALPGGQGPVAGRASSAPGHGGMVNASTRSGCAGAAAARPSGSAMPSGAAGDRSGDAGWARNWKAVPGGRVAHTPGRSVMV